MSTNIGGVVLATSSSSSTICVFWYDLLFFYDVYA